MTKKMKRVLLSAFVCAGTAILGGAALQFDKAAVKAEASPKLNICGYTLSLKDNIHIKYAVSTENTATATDFGMLVWTEPQTEYVYGTQATVLEQTSTTEQNGVEYPVFEYAELAARQMTDVVYSRAYALVDGEYYYSEVKKYSILEYAYNKLGLTEAAATSDQALIDLLNGMLEYGGLAQTYFGYKTDELASDPFAYVRVANATFADGFDYGIFRTGKEVSVTPNDGYVLSENAPNAFKADESGNVTLTVPQEKEIYETAFEIPGAYSRGLAYTLNEDGVSYSVTGIGTCTDADVIIPATYKTLPVTAIGDNAFDTFGNNAFDSYSSLKSVIIPDSVTSIGDEAFYNCDGLTSIRIPDSVTFLGIRAFRWCNNLVSVVIGDGITTILGGTFDGCNKLTSITFGANVTSIGETAFSYCNGLTAISIPEGITLIDMWVFKGCSALESVVLPKSMKTIQYQAFVDCSALKNVYYQGTAEEWMNITIGIGAFTNVTQYYYSESEPTENGNYWHYNENGEIVVWKISYSEGLAYTLNSNGVSYSVTGIGTCTDTDVVIPAKYEGLPVTLIKNYAFSGCSSLTNITIPDSITSIGAYAFPSCSGLTNITIPDSVTSIGSSAFLYCSSLTSVTIGNNVTSIGEHAFFNCDSLTSITIPDSVTSIGDSAFSWCSNLTSITVDENNVAYQSINGNLYTKDGLKLIQYAIGKTATEFTILNSVTLIGNCAFYRCSSLTSITIPDSVTSIGNYAFLGCSNLTSITIPDSVISIGISAFYSCSGLTSVTIPDSVTSIGYSAFEDCDSLTSITIPDGVTSIGDGVFSGCSNLTSITVGENNVAYQSIDGNLYTKDGLTLIQYAIGKTATKFTIPDSVTSIESSAFSGCSGLTSVIIPDSVTSIGNYAFMNCDSLTNITIPDSVTSIGNSAFYNCGNFKSIVLSNSVISIGHQAFDNCFNLTSVYYKGTAETWANITIDALNEPLTNATRYYYSESEPALNADGTAYDGNYWYYNENGEITVWEYVEATFTVVVGSNTVTVPADGTATLQFTASATSQYKITCNSGTLTDENGATVSIISCTKGEVYTVILTATAGSTVKVTIRTYDPDEENWTPNY